MSIDERLLAVATLIKPKFDNRFSATGFFYRQSDKTENPPGWLIVKDTWLVTNKHVILDKIDGSPIMAKSLSFAFRRRTQDGLEWHPVEINYQQLLERTLFHQNTNVDIAIIRISDIFLDRMKENLDNHVFDFAVSPEMLPGQNFIRAQVSDDVLIVGYPNGFYDETNLFPIIKSGIIASRYGKNFNNERCFLIDAKLMPGSSGSLVISKPIDSVVAD